MAHRVGLDEHGEAMSPLVPDPSVDALEIVWEESANFSGPRVVDCPTELRLIRDLLTRRWWQSFARFILPGVSLRHGRVYEYSGFRFPSDLDPDETPFDGVQMFDPIETIRLSEPAFVRLMARYFEAIVEGATGNDRPEIHDDWWEDFAAGARTIAGRGARPPASSSLP
jgi:hypothetical protein